MKKILIRSLVVLFIVMNAIAFMHAWKLTHFSGASIVRTKDPKQLSGAAKIKVLLLGIDNPRPTTREFPAVPYKTIRIANKIEAWRMDVAHPKGTVILFHGYAAEKSQGLSRAYEFLKLEYNTVLVDFPGSGGSDGNQTSIGYSEAAQVRDVFDFVQRNEKNPIILFGISMGAVAIMKAVDDYQLNPASVIIECPFGSLYQTVCARFRIMKAPVFPLAGLLCFWGGLQNGYWAFNHNPSQYAEKIRCPVLLLYGAHDNRVSVTETNLIFKNLQGPKELKIYATAGHDIFTPETRSSWITDVTAFLKVPKGRKQ